LAGLKAAYEAFRQDGRLPATYEVIFGHAWTPVGAAPRRTHDGTSVALDDVKRQLRAGRQRQA
jgi:malonyl-CoA O-methyltransferase